MQNVRRALGRLVLVFLRRQSNEREGTGVLPLLGRRGAIRPVHCFRRSTGLGIDYLDLTPPFARAASGERLFFEVDGHPNQAVMD